MIKIDQIISPRWMLISRENEPQQNLSVVISGNKIHDILDSHDALKKYETDEHIKLPNHILLHGLINTSLSAYYVVAKNESFWQDFVCFGYNL